jgi:transposase
MAPNTGIATRATVVALRSPLGGNTSAEVAAKTGLSVRSVNRIYARAIERGFEPNQSPLVIQDEWLEDAPRSGRPTKQTPDTTTKIIAKVRNDRYGREKSCADLAGELSEEGIDISASTIRRILKKAGFRKTKPTRKPGLTKKMMQARLQWCLRHKDWTLEDWKVVIWSDETAVVLLHRRGGYRVWRTAEEQFVRSCIRERWKGYSEFMFWGCFSYDLKGPCHSWLPETKQEKERSIKEIEKWNQELEPSMRTQWELANGIGRLSLRNLPGKKPQWHWNQKNGKLVRGSQKGGIDWYRYQTKVLIPKLFPFAERCLQDRPATIVQEDKAPSHAHHFQQRVYDLHKIRRLLWPGNSPDLNPIEPCWPWMKRYTTRKGAPKNRSEAIKVWERCWKDLTQEQIQAWIERIPRHIQKIIELEGGNEYKEGREKEG